MIGQQLFVSYLFAYLCVFGIALGAMPILMLHNLTGGAWGNVIRRPLLAAAATLPLLALLFVPILLGAHSLYAWWLETQAAPHWYLNLGFFIVRAVLYFVLWIGLAHLLARWEGTRSKQLQRVSAAGLIVYSLSASFAAFDWIMSLTPHWHSTTFGLLVTIGQMLVALAFAITVVAWFGPAERARLAGSEPDRLQDLGNLLLTFVMTWAYLAFTQYLIIWIGNLPRDISWYVPRSETSWRWLGLFVIVFYFALPFCVLLSRRAKRAARTLGGLALFVVAMHSIDMFWMVVPTFRPNGFEIRFVDVVAFLLVSGGWLAFYIRQYRITPVRALKNASASSA